MDQNSSDWPQQEFVRERQEDKFTKKVLTGQLWVYFRMLVGQSEALLQMLHLIRQDRTATSPTDLSYFAVSRL